MARIVIRSADETEMTDALGISGLSREGAVSTRAVIRMPGRPLHVLTHDMAPGARLRLDSPTFDHCFYISSGSVAVGDDAVEEGGAAIIEHLCRASIAAGVDGARLVHFHRPDDFAGKPRKAGGHVHVVDREGLLRTGVLDDTNLREETPYSGTLLADADCPTCDLWLHKSTMAGAAPQEGSLHYHTADEIIFVLSGEMLLGQRKLGEGTAMAVDGSTRYRVGAGPAGMSFLNFRAQPSRVAMLEQDLKDEMDELDLWRNSALA